MDQLRSLQGGFRVHQRVTMKASPAFLIVAVAMLCSGLAIAQGKADGVALSTDEATAFIKGKSLTASRVAGGSPSLQFKDDGSMYGTNGASNDSGKWRIEDGKLCMTWRRWDYEGCGKLVRVGEEIQHLYPNGTSVHLVFRK